MRFPARQRLWLLPLAAGLALGALAPGSYRLEVVREGSWPRVELVVESTAEDR